jgi:hypothetical protein
MKFEVPGNVVKFQIIKTAGGSVSCMQWVLCLVTSSIKETGHGPTWSYEGHGCGMQSSKFRLGTLKDR